MLYDLRKNHKTENPKRALPVVEAASKLFLHNLGFVANNYVTHFTKTGQLNSKHCKQIKNNLFLKDEENGFKIYIYLAANSG